MNQIRIKRFAFLLCIMLLLTLCGCPKTTQFGAERLDNLLLDDETVAHMESLYGVKKEKAIEKLGLSEKDISIEEGNGIVRVTWTGAAHINEPTAVPEKEFTKEMGLAWKITDTLGFHIESNLFCGIKYTCFCENEEEMADIAEALYLAAEEKYGIENHGHITELEYLCGEGAFDDIRESGNHEIRKHIGGWSEAWIVGEYSYLQMMARVKDEYGRTFAIELKYSVLPEEWSRFNPESESRVSYRNAISGEGPIVLTPFEDD